MLGQCKRDRPEESVFFYPPKYVVWLSRQLSTKVSATSKCSGEVFWSFCLVRGGVGKSLKYGWVHTPQQADSRIAIGHKPLVVGFTA